MEVGLSPLFCFLMKGSKLVSEAIIGDDYKVIVVNGKSYKVDSPTIYKLAGAGKYLSGFGEEQTLGDIFRSINDSKNLAYALSFLINGDELLADELMQGRFDELVEALGEAYSLISVQNFMMLSSLAKNVGRMIAKSK